MTATTDTRTFRYPFWRTFVALGVAVQVILIPFVAVLIALSPGAAVSTVLGYSVGEGVGMTLLLVLVLGMIWLYPVKVTPTVLTCSDAFGINRTVTWASIARVRKLAVPGVPFALVTSTACGLNLWLPLFLTEQDEFTELAAHYAGPDHPLTAMLHAEGAFRSS